MGSIRAESPEVVVKPLYSYFGLVAGEEGEKGYRDGEFFQALFNHPSGLALSFDEKLLFSADSANNCLRVIHLDEGNRVSTLAGSTTPGYQDGPLSQAYFSGPTLLTMIEKDKLAVYDPGNSAVRLVDLQRNTVTTLAGGDPRPGSIRNDPFIPALIGGVWDMDYLPSENALYLSEPDAGILQKLDLGAGKSSFALNHDPRVPEPGSFCFSQGRLFVADRKTASIYGFPMGTGGPSGDPTLLPGSQNYQISSMRDCGGVVYAVPFNNNVLLKWGSSVTPVTLTSVWGEELDNPNVPLWFLHCSEERNFLLPMASMERRFFLANPAGGAVYQFADDDFGKYRGTDSSNPQGLRDFDYPVKKPSGTFRILIVGASYPLWETGADKTRWGGIWNRMETFPKRLEQFLNAGAALNGVPGHFEVLVMAQETGSGFPAFLWPYYLVPDVVKKFDIDQVLYVAIPTHLSSLEAYYQRPLGPEGIPVSVLDPEYLLKPYEQKKVDGKLDGFFRLCRDRKLADFAPDGQVQFQLLPELLESEETRKPIEELYAKPFAMLAEKIKKARTSSDQSVDFRVCFLPLSDLPVERFEDFWTQVCRMGDIPFMDLKAQAFALKASFFPLTEGDGDRHFTANGHLLAAQILARELVTQGLIPMRVSRQEK